MHKLETILYPALLAAAVALQTAGCRAGQGKTEAPKPAVYGEVSINDSVTIKLDHAHDTTLLHRTSLGKVYVYQLENWTVVRGRRHSVVFSVELSPGEHQPHERVTVFRDGQADAGASVYYQSSPSPAPWLRWGKDGDRLTIRQHGGRLLIQFHPIHEWNGPRRLLRGYISQP